MCGFVWTWPEKLQTKAAKNYKGWFCYTYSNTSATEAHRHWRFYAWGRNFLCHQFPQDELPPEKFPWISKNKKQKNYP